MASTQNALADELVELTQKLHPSLFKIVFSYVSWSTDIVCMSTTAGASCLTVSLTEELHWRSTTWPSADGSFLANQYGCHMSAVNIGTTIVALDGQGHGAAGCQAQIID